MTPDLASLLDQAVASLRREGQRSEATVLLIRLLRRYARAENAAAAAIDTPTENGPWLASLSLA